jgi:hypothetical protein
LKEHPRKMKYCGEFTSGRTSCGSDVAWGILWRRPGTERWSWTIVHRACLPRYPGHQLWRTPRRISMVDLTWWGEEWYNNYCRLDSRCEWLLLLDSQVLK